MAQERIALVPGKEDSVVEAAATVLEAGGVLVFPTETVYGVGVVSGNARALERLRRLKQRDAAKPFQFLAADVAMAQKLGAVFDGHARKLARNFWPGPLTLVVPDGMEGGSTLGIRVPDSLFVEALCRRLGRAIVSSSANPGGQPPPLEADAADVFGDEADLLVDGGPVVGGAPSTVVKCDRDSYTVLREGEIGLETLRAAWEE